MITVTAAIILDDRGRVLVGLRPADKRLGGLWEFPGGKLEPGETPEACLARELLEELGVTARIGVFIGESVHNYEFGTIRLVAYEAIIEGGRPSPLDHARLDWVAPEALSGIELTPADRPLLPVICAFAAARG
jgi:8-oxo-dGTP diphosphatase